jgi:PAS domain S-box-containing protein
MASPGGDMRILVVDDHELVRKGIRAIVGAEPGMSICGEACDGIDAVEKAKLLRPNVVVMDISMPLMNGLDATRRIKDLLPQTEIVIVSQHQNKEMLRQATNAGAKAYVTKSGISCDLIKAITTVANNERSVNFAKAISENQIHDEQEIIQRNAVLEKALRETEHNFREMLDVLPVAIYTTDTEGRLTYFNPAAIEFSGRIPEIGTDHWCVSWKLFNADGAPMRHEDCPMAKAIKEGHIVDGIEAIAERPDGSRIWFTPYHRPLHDGSGKPIGGINMLFDITERKTVEQSTGLLAAIVDSSDDAIISKNLDSIITSWNKAAERLFGYIAKEVVGKSITLLIPQERIEEEKMILEQIRRGDQIKHFETVRIHKDGTPIDISVTISPIRDSMGNIVGASKVARDITERKQSERALRESEERFRAIVETTPECVKLVAADGTLLHMNPPGLVMVGADSSEQVTGKNVYNLIAPHDRDRFRDFNERICRGERGNLEFDIVSLTGSNHHMQTHAAPLRMADGTVVHLAVTRDITEQKRSQVELRRSEERLRELANGLEKEVSIRTQELERRNSQVLQRTEQLRELSIRLLRSQDDERRRIARELHDSAGQVLTAMGMNLAVINQSATENPFLARAVEESQQLVQQLTKEIRTMSYLLHPPLLDENGLSGALRWYVEGMTQRSGIEITLNISKDFGRIGDGIEMAIFRIVQECLTNIHRHSGSSKASIYLLRNAEHVVLEVKDDGKGISPAKLAEIQSHRSGVGIAGIRERVLHLGGQMQIESVGTGTLVRATFKSPVAQDFQQNSILQNVNAE